MVTIYAINEFISEQIKANKLDIDKDVFVNECLDKNAVYLQFATPVFGSITEISKQYRAKLDNVCAMLYKNFPHIERIICLYGDSERKTFNQKRIFEFGCVQISREYLESFGAPFQSELISDSDMIKICKIASEELKKYSQSFDLEQDADNLIFEIDNAAVQVGAKYK